jgi:hypothetical protein
MDSIEAGAVLLVRLSVRLSQVIVHGGRIIVADAEKVESFSIVT